MTRRNLIPALGAAAIARPYAEPSLKPPALKPGDTVGLITPATYVSDPDRIALLRQAFDETMKDPSFVSDARTLYLEVNPMSGEAMQAKIERILGFDAREGWPGWDLVRAQLPESEMQDLIVELR